MSVCCLIKESIKCTPYYFDLKLTINEINKTVYGHNYHDPCIINILFDSLCKLCLRLVIKSIKYSLCCCHTFNEINKSVISNSCVVCLFVTVRRCNNLAKRRIPSAILIFLNIPLKISNMSRKSSKGKFIQITLIEKISS